MAATGPRSGPRAGKLFYGWVVVAASFTIVAVGYGLQFSYGVFLPYMMADLGLDLVAATAPFSLYVLIYSLMCFVSGPATDRFGPRMVVVTGGIMLALGYALLTTSTGNWQLYAYLSLVAGIGMSAVFVPLNATVVRWFIRRRGFALAVIGSGSNAALLFGPMLAALLIPWLGWRGGLLALSLLGGLIITACALALVRDPEARRLLPDGHGAEAPADAEASPTVGEVSWSLGEARSTAAFWLITGIYVLTWAMLFFPFVHLPILAIELGYGPASAASLIGVMGVGGFVGRMAIGWLSDLIGRSPGLAVALAAQIVGYVIFAQSGHLAYLYVAAAVFSAGNSSCTSLLPAVAGDAFGRGHAGAITGFIVAIAGAAAAIGPFAASLIKDATGSYQTAFLIGAALNIAAIILLTLLRPPQK